MGGREWSALRCDSPTTYWRTGRGPEAQTRCNTFTGNKWAEGQGKFSARFGGIHAQDVPAFSPRRRHRLRHDENNSVGTCAGPILPPHLIQ